jgi:hypothetical protein
MTDQSETTALVDAADMEVRRIENLFQFIDPNIAVTIGCSLEQIKAIIKTLGSAENHG